MPLASFKPEVKPEVKPNLPAVEPDNYKSVIYDDNNVPLTSLIAFIEGAPWTLKEFYTQVVSEHNDLREVDTGESGGYQSYLKFIGLEVRVDQELSSTFDPASGITKVEGSATSYPFMQVNVGDAFIVNTSDNKESVFELTSVERKTFNRDSAWAISYRLKGYTDDPQIKPFVDNLRQKTIKTYHFSKQRLIEGLQPFIKTEEYANVTNLRHVYEDVVKYYFKNVFNIRFLTLVIPGQEQAIYDSGLVNYLLKIVSTDDAQEIMRLKRIPTDNEPYLNQPNFWSMMDERDYDVLLQCNDVMGVVSKEEFNNNTFLHSIRYSNIQYLVYPKDPDTSLKLRYDPLAKVIDMDKIIDTMSFKGQQYTDIDNTYVTDAKSYKIIHEVLVDDKYVLSSNFYQNTEDQSLLEILVKDYLQGQFVNLDKLYACCNVFKKWKRLEQFYYGPLLITLLRDAYRAQYT